VDVSREEGSHDDLDGWGELNGLMFWEKEWRNGDV